MRMLQSSYRRHKGLRALCFKVPFLLGGSFEYPQLELNELRENFKCI